MRFAAFLVLALAAVCSREIAWVQTARADLPVGYSVDVDESGTTTTGNLGGSGSLRATGQKNVTYGHALECAPSSNGGPFSSAYPPQDCAQVGRTYATSGSPEKPSGFWFTGNKYCSADGRVQSGSTFTWQVQLSESGYWHLEVYIPSWTSYGWGDQYILNAADGQSQRTGFTQQSYHGRWVQLFGSHLFLGGNTYSVELTPADSADQYCHYQMADQVKWVFDRPLPPRDVTPPTITGDATEGEVLTEAHGMWTNDPTSYRYQWEDCDSAGGSCVPIAGATSQQYTLGSRDVGHRLVVTETASNGGGSGSPATSTPTAVVATAGKGCSSFSRGPARGRGLYRVFSSWLGQIAVPPRGNLSSASYHFQTPRSRPFGRTTPQIYLAPVIIDSTSRRVFLQFSRAGQPDVILTGAFCSTPLKRLGRGAFSLRLTIPLTNLVTGAASGTFSVQVKGRVIRGGLVISLSDDVVLYPGVIGAGGYKSRTGQVSAKLKATGGQVKLTHQPVGYVYIGATEHYPIQIVLNSDRSGIYSVFWSTPTFLCSNPFWSYNLTHQFISVSGWLNPNGFFSAYAVGDSTYPNGELAGYYDFSIYGRFGPRERVRKKGGGYTTEQAVAGTYLLTAYNTSGPAAGSTCSHNAGYFAAT